MFRKNEPPREPGPSSIQGQLPKKLRERLENSWAQTFREEVFYRIDEEPFAVLYSDQPSRPNTPVNVLVGLDILKAGFGWSDEELYDHVSFDILTRHALALDDLGIEIFEIRTLYNFRQRVREYAEETGINLFSQVFDQVTDEQLAAVGVATGWQRMDSTQVLSNLAALTRLELIVSVVQQVYRALEEESQARWQERLAPYLGGRPQKVCRGIKGHEVEAHLIALGEMLVALAEELAEYAPDSAAYALAERVLREQYRIGSEGEVTVRPGEEISADSLQSPHDPEATFRVKSGKTYRGGYVVNVSETCEPENPLQLITDVQVAPNLTDDAELLERSLDNQAEREIDVEKATTDGGYTGPVAEAACDRHEVDLRATRMRGGQSAADRLGWEAYTWTLDDDGRPVRVTCPHGQTVELEPGQADGRFIGRFDPDICATCPFFNRECRGHPRRAGPTLYVTWRSIKAAIQRQRLRPEDKPIRAVVEATIRSVKHPFPGGKLPVRGLIRATMVVCGAALMVNLRRLHAYRQAQAGAQRAAQPAPSPIERVLRSLGAVLGGLSTPWQRLAPASTMLHRPQPAPVAAWLAPGRR
ncbi:MAG: transposase [Anaerolineae bacterium]